MLTDAAAIESVVTTLYGSGEYDENDQAIHARCLLELAKLAIARAALICNREDELGFAEDDVPVLLSLIDQIHGLRFELKGLLDALEELPPDVRATVRMRIASRREGT